ncbi:MAG: hypothetical protein A4E55_02425 [Pelotomaculum sp. PtaU1.Bin035]|nr:MAG: hypothetical protein A4E55_02425 [Pelotomaculum sp. PtaU1.Bin035]
MSQRGTSNAPLILGIIGAIVSLPNVLCASTCGAIVGMGATNSHSGAGFGVIFGFAPVIIGFISAFLGKSNPVISGAGLLIAAVCTFIFLVITLFTNIFAWAALILFLIGGIMAFVQKKEAS